MIAAAFQLALLVYVIDRHGRNTLAVTAKKIEVRLRILAVYIAVKDVLPALSY